MLLLPLGLVLLLLVGRKARLRRSRRGIVWCVYVCGLGSCLLELWICRWGEQWVVSVAWVGLNACWNEWWAFREEVWLMGSGFEDGWLCAR